MEIFMPMAIKEEIRTMTTLKSLPISRKKNPFLMDIRILTGIFYLISILAEISSMIMITQIHLIQF